MDRKKYTYIVQTTSSFGTMNYELRLGNIKGKTLVHKRVPNTIEMRRRIWEYLLGFSDGAGYSLIRWPPDMLKEENENVLHG